MIESPSVNTNGFDVKPQLDHLPVGLKWVPLQQQMIRSHPIWTESETLGVRPNHLV